MPRYKNAPQRQKIVKWKDADPSKDIVIIVVGETGVGISTFVKDLLDDDDEIVKVREIDDADLESCTRDLQPVHVKNAQVYLPPGRRLVVLDTPGFNNSNPKLPDLMILNYIEQWLALSYSPGIQRLGVIFLHDITQSRITSETLNLFNGLSALCRNPGHKTAVVLGTTKWPGEEQGAVNAQRREDQLENKFWKEMIRQGAETGQVKNTKESAWEIVQRILAVIKAQGDAGVQADIRKSPRREKKCVIC